MDLTEAEDIKKRWQEYTGELYKKDVSFETSFDVLKHLLKHLYDPDNHDGVISHLEPDTLE